MLSRAVLRTRPMVLRRNLSTLTVASMTVGGAASLAPPLATLFAVTGNNKQPMGCQSVVNMCLSSVRSG